MTDTRDGEAVARIRAKLAKNGRNPANNNAGIRVGSDLHLCEMLLKEYDNLSRQLAEAREDAITDRTYRDIIWNERLAEAQGVIERLKNRIDTRLNDYLCEMKPGYDDSIVGFNEAWDIVRKCFPAPVPDSD